MGPLNGQHHIQTSHRNFSKGRVCRYRRLSDYLLTKHTYPLIRRFISFSSHPSMYNTANFIVDRVTATRGSPAVSHQ